MSADGRNIFSQLLKQARKDTEERVAWLMKEWEDLSLRLSAVSGDAR